MLYGKRHITRRIDEQTVSVHCAQCGTDFPVKLTHEQALFWMHGKHIQSVLPTEKADTRELLISGTCGPCFDAMFAE